MSTHSPGPWEATHWRSYSHEHRGRYTHVPAQWLVVTTDSSLVLRAENEADARLAAASIDLLAACEAARDRLDCREMPVCDDDLEPAPHDEWCTDCKAREQLDAAVAKARGTA